jgi:hypothetical protein
MDSFASLPGSSGANSSGSASVSSAAQWHAILEVSSAGRAGSFTSTSASAFFPSATFARNAFARGRPSMPGRMEWRP